MMIGKRECTVLVSACAAALFTVGAAAATDPRAGNPEGERIALWPEGKVPSAEEHQYNAPLLWDWLVQVGFCGNANE